MQTFYLSAPAEQAALPALIPVNLAALDAKQLACLLVSPPSHLLIDCGGLLVPHPWGVSHFITQLLKLRGRGTSIRLCRVHPVLARCVHHLHLDGLFQLTD